MPQNVSQVEEVMSKRLRLTEHPGSCAKIFTSKKLLSEAHPSNQSGKTNYFCVTYKFSRFLNFIRVIPE